jgi:DNA repair photolyase
MHVHLAGECSHKCIYCYVDSKKFGRPVKYTGPLRLIEKEFNVQYGSGKTIFIENCNDLFASDVPVDFINKILEHCSRWPFNTYVFQTKNPIRFFDKNLISFPPISMFGTTIETNREIDNIGNAPSPKQRYEAMLKFNKNQSTFITIEPVLDFDVDILAKWIYEIDPRFLNLGADSKNHNLPEPTIDKIHNLVAELHRYGIELREKHNLKRLMNIK